MVNFTLLAINGEGKEILSAFIIIFLYEFTKKNRFLMVNVQQGLTI
jgi:hypothetical protein